jgi:hypothetical protein
LAGRKPLHIAEVLQMAIRQQQVADQQGKGPVLKYAE